MEFHMDYSGQKLAEWMFQRIIIVFAIIGFFVGYGTEKLSYSMYILGAGCALAGLVALPPWGIYRKDPIEWRKPVGEEEPTTYAPIQKSGKSKKKN